jgi:hypothetical protein
MATLIDEFHGPVTYNELINSMTSQYVNGELILKRDFLTPWDTRWVFARKMLGYHYLATNSGGTTYIRRIIPQFFNPLGIDDFTNPAEQFKMMFCSSMESMDPVRPKEWDATYKEGVNLYAKVSFTYRYPTYSIFSDIEVTEDYTRNPDPIFGSTIADVKRLTTETISREIIYPQDPDPTPQVITEIFPFSCHLFRYISKQIQPSAQHLVLPYGRFYFVDGNGAGQRTPATNVTTKLISKTEVIYTWHWVPTSDITGNSQVKKIQRYIGSVNQYAFDGYPPQTLLFTAINSRPFRQVGGHYTTDIELRMTYFEVLERYRKPNGFIIPLINDDKAVGHNYFLRFSSSEIFKRLEAGTATPDEIAEWLNLGYRYDLLTHDGTSDGRRLFQPKDFYDLFLPSAD